MIDSFSVIGELLATILWPSGKYVSSWKASEDVSENRVGLKAVVELDVSSWTKLRTDVDSLVALSASISRFLAEHSSACSGREGFEELSKILNH